MKASKKTIDAVIECIHSGTSYRKILQLVPEIKSTSMINRIKKIHIEGKSPSHKKLSDKTKRKIQIAAVERKALEKSDLIINSYINVVEAFKYSINNLDEIQLLHKSKTDELFIMLNTIINKLDEYFLKSESDNEEQLYIRTSLINAASRISNVHKNSLLRIKAIDSLRGQIDSFLKFKVDVEGIEQINFLIMAFLKGTEILTDEQYFKYKAAVINHNEFARVFFDRWDSGVHQSDLSETEEPDEEKMGDGSKHNN